MSICHRISGHILQRKGFPLHIRAFSQSSTSTSKEVAFNDPATDLNINLKGGRQSVSGVTATVFGSSGFLARYVINRLGRIGTRVICPYRGDGMNVRHLKLMGDLGQIIQRPIDMTDIDSIRETVKESDVVINLIGSCHETKNYSYHDVNVKVTHRIAKICAEAGHVKRFIHVSAAGASHDAKSEFLKTKAMGEDVVKDFFPNATIIRPCNIFGEEDKFLNRIADLVNYFPFVPMVGKGEKKIQPIYVQDAAQCVVNAMVNSEAPGKTYTIGGPEVLSKSELIDFVSEQCIRPSAGVEMPEFACRLFAKAVSHLPASWRLLSLDDLDQNHSELTVPRRVLTCEDLGVTPATLAKEAPYQFTHHRGLRDYDHQNFPLPRRCGKIEEF